MPVAHEVPAQTAEIKVNSEKGNVAPYQLWDTIPGLEDPQSAASCNFLALVDAVCNSNPAQSCLPTVVKGNVLLIGMINPSIAGLRTTLQTYKYFPQLLLHSLDEAGYCGNNPPNNNSTIGMCMHTLLESLDIRHEITELSINGKPLEIPDDVHVVNAEKWSYETKVFTNNDQLPIELRILYVPNTSSERDQTEMLSALSPLFSICSDYQLPAETVPEIIAQAIDQAKAEEDGQANMQLVALLERYVAHQYQRFSQIARCIYKLAGDNESMQEALTNAYNALIDEQISILTDPFKNHSELITDTGQPIEEKTQELLKTSWPEFSHSPGFLPSISNRPIPHLITPQENGRATGETNFTEHVAILENAEKRTVTLEELQEDVQAILRKPLEET